MKNHLLLQRKNTPKFSLGSFYLYKFVEVFHVERHAKTLRSCTVAKSDPPDLKYSDHREKVPGLVSMVNDIRIDISVQ